MIGLIEVPYWWHASLLEICWLVGGLMSLIITTVNLLDAWKDNSVLDEIRADKSIHARYYKMIVISAHGRLQSQIFRNAISGLIAGVGVVGVLTANPLGGGTTWTGLAVSVALVGISGLTALISFFDLVRRNQLYDLATKRTEVLATQMIIDEREREEED